jgi:hypothetical protein
MAIRLFALWLLVLAMPLGLSAHEPTHEAVVSTYTTALRAGEQVVATATCPPGMEVLTGGYKLLHSTITMRALVVVENRPAPQARQWLVALLYDPAPGETPQGDITLETSAVCRPAPHMGQRHL